ncbi:MAG: metal-dependent hydrolase [Polyangiales bacterium]
MDNITHSLFGYALGRACAARSSPAPARAGTDDRLTRALIAGSVVGSNTPDFDFVFGFLGGDRRLSYLVEHRGFTHTLIVALVLGALVGLGCCAGYRLRAARERALVVGISALACWLHIAFDFLNDYGVHPFYPFDGHWYYGDSVFIVEPLLLAVLLPLPMFSALTRVGRGLSAALSLGLVLLVWLAGASWPSALLVTVLLVSGCLLQGRLQLGAAPTLLATAAVVGVFALGSQLAKAAVRDALHAAAPDEHILDIVASPVPANPTCVRAISLSLDPAGTYHARLARARAIGEASQCNTLPTEPSAPLSAADIPSTKGVHFESTFKAPAAELKQLNARCDAAIMLRFVRAPFWKTQPEATLLGDLRYDRAPTLEFAERLITGICQGRQPIAPWTPPRSDLLAPGGG